jgi:hypothetical protein
MENCRSKVMGLKNQIFFNTYLQEIICPPFSWDTEMWISCDSTASRRGGGGGG